MLLRQADSTDLDQILANGKTFSESAYPDIPYDPESFFDCAMQMMADGLLIVAEEDGQHMGGIGAIKGPLAINKHVTVAMERFLWMKPEHRKSGIGGILLDELEKAAKAQGCARILMIALEDESLPVVGGFYKKKGYRAMEHFFMKVL